MKSILMILGVFLLSGCDLLFGEEDGSGGNSNPVAKSKPKAPKEGDASFERLVAAIAAQEGYVYNPIGKRDPFRSFLGVGGEGDSGPDDSPRTPLQRYELDEYHLVGIIWGVDRPRALVEDPDRVGHVMEIGTYIGKNWGKVTQITSTEVVVTEEYQTIDGELVVNPIRMTMPVNVDRVQ
jgi:type IV pilus assembly protein PilP